jgi:hypothetical protein
MKNGETANLILSGIVSVVKEAAAEEGETAGEEAEETIETESSSETLEEVLIEGFPDIQGRHHLDDVTLEIVIHSKILCQEKPIHTFQLAEGSITEGDPLLHDQHLLRPQDHHRTRAPHTTGGLDRLRDLALRLTDVGLGRLADVAPMEVELAEEGEEVQIAEPGGDR